VPFFNQRSVVGFNSAVNVAVDVAFDRGSRREVSSMWRRQAQSQCCLGGSFCQGDQAQLRMQESVCVAVLSQCNSYNVTADLQHCYKQCQRVNCYLSIQLALDVTDMHAASAGRGSRGGRQQPSMDRCHQLAQWRLAIVAAAVVASWHCGDRTAARSLVSTTTLAASELISSGNGNTYSCTISITETACNSQRLYQRLFSLHASVGTAVSESSVSERRDS
jgi:hypothetical protein